MHQVGMLEILYIIENEIGKQAATKGDKVVSSSLRFFKIIRPSKSSSRDPEFWYQTQHLLRLLQSSRIVHPVQHWLAGFLLKFLVTDGFRPSLVQGSPEFFLGLVGEYRDCLHEAAPCPGSEHTLEILTIPPPLLTP